MFISALFTIARKWKQPKHPPTEDWIMKMQCVHNGMLCNGEENCKHDIVGKWMEEKDVE